MIQTCKMAIVRLIEEWDTLPSTQDRAIQLAKEGAPHGSYVIAKQQTAGYGASGKWWSPLGGCFFSCILESGDIPTPVSLAASRLAHRLRQYCVFPVDIQSLGNDIMIGSRKLGGVIGCRLLKKSIFGFGINVSRPAYVRSDLQDNITFLSDHIAHPGTATDLVRFLLEPE